jgi:hypothetical protein
VASHLVPSIALSGLLRIRQARLVHQLLSDISGSGGALAVVLLSKGIAKVFISDKFLSSENR